MANPLYEKLFELQTAYNLHTNITRISSKEDYYTKHIEDSLALLPFIAPLEKPQGTNTEAVRLLDIGTGAGYPGLPLAIERPDLQVVLNDATQKKIRYVQSAIEALDLSNATAIWGRAEQLSQQPEHKKRYAYATVRAVARIKELLVLVAPFLAKGGQALFMKAKNVEAEIAAAKRTAVKNEMSLLDVHKYQIAGMDRAIVIYGKE